MVQFKANIALQNMKCHTLRTPKGQQFSKSLCNAKEYLIREYNFYKIYPYSK